MVCVRCSDANPHVRIHARVRVYVQTADSHGSQTMEGPSNSMIQKVGGTKKLFTRLLYAMALFMAVYMVLFLTVEKCCYRSVA